jgi:hypothetical protein
MRLFVSGGTKTVRRLAAANQEHLGILLTPASWNSVASISQTGLAWGADNAAFSGFDAEKFRTMLAKIKQHDGRPVFIVAPDVVGNADLTLGLFEQWQEEVREAGPVALVLQDGQENRDLPEADAFFVGGSTKFKLSQAVGELCEEIRYRFPKKWLHMGRVNSFRRFQAAIDLGCDSVDGSSASRFSETWVPKYLQWIKRIEAQPVLGSQF